MFSRNIRVRTQICGIQLVVVVSEAHDRQTGINRLAGEIALHLMSPKYSNSAAAACWFPVLF